MKTVVVTSILFFLSCNLKKSPIQSSQNNTTYKQSSVEDFDFFFEKFKRDSTLQKYRIDKPLVIISYEENEEEKSVQQVNFVSFSSSEWNSDPILSKSIIAKDTININLQIEDTGINLDHYFVLRKDQWYLYQIKNSSD